MEGLSEVLATADALYGLLPEAFTAARDDHVRRLRRGGAHARALAVKDLRRPSVAAWVVNALVRHRRAELEQLMQVGQALRDAQDILDPGQLRELNRQRQVVLTAVCREARALATELGRPASEQALGEVEATLRAALADPAAAAAVRAGRLTTSLQYAGFGAADGSAARAATAAPAAAVRAGRPGGAVAARSRTVVTPRFPVQAPDPRPAPSPGSGSVPLREAALALRAAEDAAQRAEGAALAAEQHRDTLLRRARTAQERLEAAHAQVAEVESLLTAARAATSTAAAAWAPLHAEADAAGARADSARGLAACAHAMLAAARTHLADVQQADVQQADVQQADVQQADVQQADVQQADVQQADVQQADVQQAADAVAGRR